MNPNPSASALVPVFLAQVRQPVTLVGRRPAPTSEVQSFLLPSLLCSLCVLALGAIVIRAWRRRAASPGRRALNLVARSLGLSASERALIETIASPEPAAALVSEHAFRATVERWAASNPRESERRTLKSLSARLGWNAPELPSAQPATEEPPAPVRLAARSKPVPARRLKLVA